jgi:MoxR-like ATPase
MEERKILEMGLNGTAPQGRAVASPLDLEVAMRAVRELSFDDSLKEYVIQVVHATRRPADYRLPQLTSLIAFGASPRASIAFGQAARAHAFLEGRGYVSPEDLKAVAHDVLRHRIVTTYEAEAEELTTDDLIDRVLDRVDIP